MGDEGIQMDDLIIRIGKLIKGQRLEKGYSTQELSEKLDVSTGLINNIENGKTDTFNVNLMEKLCSTLDIDIMSLLANKVDDVLNLLNISRDIPAELSVYTNKLIHEYTKAAIELNFNSSKLETLLNKLVYEINFVIDIEK
jgi:transcriptional regulator with XRE-family HTH domain